MQVSSLKTKKQNNARGFITSYRTSLDLNLARLLQTRIFVIKWCSWKDIIILPNFSVSLKQSNQTRTAAGRFSRFSKKDCVGFVFCTLFSPFSLTVGALFENLLPSGLFKQSKYGCLVLVSFNSKGKTPAVLQRKTSVKYSETSFIKGNKEVKQKLNCACKKRRETRTTLQINCYFVQPSEWLAQ